VNRYMLFIWSNGPKQLAYGRKVMPPFLEVQSAFTYSSSIVDININDWTCDFYERYINRTFCFYKNIIKYKTVYLSYPQHGIRDIQKILKKNKSV
jgi:hypothetical protein